MRKQEQEALRRLEAALLEQEQPEEAVIEEDFPDEIWQELSGTDYDAYNTDVADVDMDAYSEDVRHGRQGSGVLPLLVAVSILLLVFAVGILLKFLGVI